MPLTLPTSVSVVVSVSINGFNAPRISGMALSGLHSTSTFGLVSASAAKVGLQMMPSASAVA